MTDALPRSRVMCAAHLAVDCVVCAPEESPLERRVAALERENADLREALDSAIDAVTTFRFERECDAELAVVLLERLRETRPSP